MSASAMIDGLIAVLSGSAIFGANMVGNYDFSVLERASACCAVVGFAGIDAHPTTFANPSEFENEWTLDFLAFIKDTGNPALVGPRINSMVDSVLTSIKANDTLQGTCDLITGLKGSHTLGEGLEVGGAIWFPVAFRVTAKEF